MHLTTRQSELLAFLTAYERQHGYAATIREIGLAMGITSPNGVMSILHPLQKKGVITWTPGRARTIRVIAPAQDPDLSRVIAVWPVLHPDERRLLLALLPRECVP